MQYFESDYMEGAHPLILQRLIQTNMKKTTGYGFDPYCDRAKEKIKQACNCPQGEVYFMVGGTQANATVIKGLLRSYQGVIAPDTGHIAHHEGGALETGGHKVITLPQKEGKITALQVQAYLDKLKGDDSRDHIVKPGMVYISHPTECGTLYTRKELEDLSRVCRQNDLPLYLDGARLGYGLMAEGTDVTLPLIAQCCDVFYIGGTKVGALFGEAVVFTNHKIKSFFTVMKQQGAVLAKGRMLGIQFDTLFTDGLYMAISKQAITMAQKLKDAFKQKGYRFYFESPTNQIFVVLENSKMEQLQKKVSFSFWEAIDSNHTVVRFATSWATKEEDVDEVIGLL